MLTIQSMGISNSFTGINNNDRKAAGPVLKTLDRDTVSFSGFSLASLFRKKELPLNHWTKVLAQDIAEITERNGGVLPPDHWGIVLKKDFKKLMENGVDVDGFRSRVYSKLRNNKPAQKEAFEEAQRLLRTEELGGQADSLNTPIVRIKKELNLQPA